ncbi:MAG: hypothetical protein JWM86_1553, partial [Thermoleophilia bacterium]|nr:hypothetical protein [Thermoleophilia bacterium]
MGIAVIIAAVIGGTYVALAVLARAVEGWIRHEVIVDAPLDVVWAYGSDSTRAAEWSVFFHHI